MTRRAEPLSRPSSTIFPRATPTSPWKAGRPEPSMTRPFLIKRSYVMGSLLLVSLLSRALAPRRGLVHGGRPDHTASRAPTRRSLRGLTDGVRGPCHQDEGPLGALSGANLSRPRVPVYGCR